jgi:hypothetical protein
MQLDKAESANCAKVRITITTIVITDLLSKGLKIELSTIFSNYIFSFSSVNHDVSTWDVTDKVKLE